MNNGTNAKKILRNEFNTVSTSVRTKYNIPDLKTYLYICTDHIVNEETRTAAEAQFIKENLCSYYEVGLDIEPELEACVVWMGNTRLIDDVPTLYVK